MAGSYRQYVPRPGGAELGPAPSWCALDPDARAHVPVAAVRAAFGSPFVAVDDDVARAAVLVPVFERDEEAFVVLTRRSARLSANPGDMAFPGGRVEPGEHLLDAALRESDEEIGLVPDLVEVIGQLSTVERPRDGRHIAPFVAVVAGAPDLVASVAEVEAIIEVPLACLLGDGVAWRETWVREGLRSDVAFFAEPVHLGDDVVWGATARICWELCERICARPAIEER